MERGPGKTQVAIVGAGPAGSLLAYLLRRQGIGSVILERRSRAYVLSRIRAGVLEHGSVQVLWGAGLARSLLAQAFTHHGVAIASGDRMVRIDFKRLTDKHVTIYGQTQLQRDLYDALDAAGCHLIDEVDRVQLHDLESGRAKVTFDKDGQTHHLECDFVAGCDGAHGVCRGALTEKTSEHFERVYPYGWLGVLSRTPPVSEELIYAHNPRGFALCSMRNAQLSRYYLQCPLDAALEDWPDERFWAELKARLPARVTDQLVTGPSIEKSITPLRSFVLQPMRRGRLFLAGDAAHVVPPTGAKGLNLAISDVAYLHEAIAHHYATGSSTGLDEYSARALARVWKAVRFSWWMTMTLHRAPQGKDHGDARFAERLQHAEIDYLFSSEAAQRVLAENYVGLPL